jgi:hypothetical protein
MVLMIYTDMIWFNKQGKCSIILETWIYYHEKHSLICLKGLSRGLDDLHRLDSLLYILCIRRGCKLVTNNLFKQNERQ